MADVLTATYKFTQPEVGGSDDTWGDKLNANWGKLDGFLVSAAIDETGFSGGTTSILGTALRIAGTTPLLNFTETDQVLPVGRYRFAGSAGALLLTANTAAAGDFTTSINVFTTSATGITFGVPVGGNPTFLGSPTISSTSPQLYFEETDQTDPAGRYRFYGSLGNFYFQRATSADWGSVSSVWSYVNGGDFTFSAPVVMGSNLTVSGNLTSGGYGRLNLDGTSPYIWFHDSDGVVATRNFMISGNNGTLRLSRSDDAGTTVATMFTGTEDDVYIHPNAHLASVGGTVEIGHSTVSNITFQRSGTSYVRWPNAGSVSFQTDTAVVALHLTGATASIYPLTRLAVTDGTVEIGHSTSAMLVFQRSGINYLRWPNAAGSLYLQTDTGVNTAILSGTLFNTYPVTKLAINDGTVEIGNTTSSSIEFKRSSGGINYLKPPDGTTLRVQATGGGNWASVSSASGWVAGTCDIRLKENVSDIHYGLETILSLRPVEFDRLADGLHDLGLVSQEVQLIVPEAIEPSLDEESGTTYLFLRKDNFVPILIKAVQELAARVQTLEGA